MRRWKYREASDAVGQLLLRGCNGDVARHWLSLWTAKPPTLSKFQIGAAVGSASAASAVIAVTPGQRAHCRWSGTIFNLVTGADLTGRDLLEMLDEPDDRAQRLAYFDSLVEGAVGVAERRAHSVLSGNRHVQLIGLPFADLSSDGVRHVLLHVDWRPSGSGWIMSNAKPNLGLCEQHCLIALS